CRCTDHCAARASPSRVSGCRCALYPGCAPITRSARMNEKPPARCSACLGPQQVDMGMESNVVVFGQLARDLVLVVDQVPPAGQSGRVRRRRELLGGKGANQAVALAQLGMRPSLVAVAGDDQTGTRLIEQVGKDGIDTSAVIRRPGTRSGLIVDVVTPDGQWRYLEDLPQSVLLTEEDVAAAEDLTANAPWVSIQLQQPPGAVLAAARQAAAAGARVVLDGAPDANGHTDDLLALASVVRADAKEASLLT